MLFKADLTDRIARGEVTVAFRSWRRPTVKPGGTLITLAGQLEIVSVDPIDPAAVTDADARRAGFADAAAVRAFLDPARTPYRIEFRLRGEDPRIALRNDAVVDDADRAALDRKLSDDDLRALHAIAERPATAARLLAADLGVDKDRLKVRIRRMKGFGLTESLGTGYRLSPRGRTYLGLAPADPEG